MLTFYMIQSKLIFKMLRKPINPNWLEYGKQSKVIEKEHMHMLKEALEKEIHG